MKILSRWPVGIDEHKNEFSKSRKKRLRKLIDITQEDGVYLFKRMETSNWLGKRADLLGLYGQVNKRILWMPRQ